jgi:hypothetical protein
MAQVYRIYKRKGIYYSFHGPTGKRESLHTSDKQEARAMIAAKSESVCQPQLIDLSRNVKRIYYR